MADACRCCLVRAGRGRGLEPLRRYRHLLAACCGLHFTKNDRLPNKICTDCSKILKQFYNFKKRCQDNNSILLKRLNERELVENRKTKKQKNMKKDTNTTADRCLKTNVVNTKLKELPNTENAFEVQPMSAETKLKDFDVEQEVDIKKEDLREAVLNVEYLEENFTYDQFQDIPEVKKENDTPMTDDVEIPIDVLHTIKMTKSCPACLKSNTSLRQLRDHYKFVHMGIMFYCKICMKNFHSEYRHNLRKHKAYVYNRECHVCNEKFNHKHAYSKHMTTVHRSEHLSCGCGKQFKEVKVFNQHLCIAKGNLLHCPICEKSHKSKYHLERHIAARHKFVDSESAVTPPPVPLVKDRQTICTICNKSFDTTRRLRDHINVVHFNIRFFCEICQENYSSEQRHMRMKHNVSLINKTCHVCREQFRSYGAYGQHMAANHDLGPLQCECGAKFNSKKRLCVHREKVHEMKRYICEVCSKIFANRHSFHRHVQGHSEGKLKLLQCPQCTRTVKGLSAYNKHVASHNAARDVPCGFCPMLFLKESDRKQHLKRHMSASAKSKLFGDKKRTHPCAACDKKFTRSDVRNEHERNVHKYNRRSELLENGSNKMDAVKNITIEMETNEM